MSDPGIRAARRKFFAIRADEMRDMAGARELHVERFKRLAEAARTDERAHRELLQALEKFVDAYCSNLALIADMMPRDVARRDQLEVLANKEGTVTPEERRKVLGLNRSLKAEWPVAADRYDVIGEQLGCKARRVRYICEKRLHR